MSFRPIPLWKKAGTATLLCLFASHAFGAPDKGAAIKSPSDVACLVLEIHGFGSAEGEKKRAFNFAAVYFLGRYHAGHNEEPLSILMQREIARQVMMEPQALNRERAACATMISDGGRMLKTMGSELKKRGR